LSADLQRREFLIRFCQGVGATLIPSGFWGLGFQNRLVAEGAAQSATQSPIQSKETQFLLHPHYRSERPLDVTLQKVQAGTDEFITEKYADQIGAILAEWSAVLLQSPNNTQAVARTLSADFFGGALQPEQSRIIRNNPPVEVQQNKFSTNAHLSRDAFLGGLQSYFKTFSAIVTAEFRITSIEALPVSTDSSKLATQLRTQIRYEIVGTGVDFYREQRVGSWELTWVASSSSNFQIQKWRAFGETQARTNAPVYVDIAATALGANTSFAAQMLHGTDYWRTLIDGASGIDIYGHNGVSAADIDNDGFDDLYVCQPAGLPNRLYRNRGDAHSKTSRNLRASAFSKIPPAPCSPTSRTAVYRM
jgi:hypothetical protein